MEENLRLARPNATEEELWQALEQVNLAAFLRGEQGLSTQLSSLRQRLEQEPAFIKHQGQITFSTQLLWELDRPHYFQAIILSYPIDLLSDEMLQRSLEACANLLREGGTVSCLEMAWVRKIREFINSCWRRNSCQPTEPTCLELCASSCPWADSAGA